MPKGASVLQPPSEETFAGSGGPRIFLRSWRPQGQPRAVLVICHGVNSHGGQYAWPAEQFAQGGLAVYALDLRGRGRSEGERFFVEHVSEYVSDLSGAVNIAKSRDPGLPVFLLGHSAGGVVGATYAVESQAELAGFICESFAFQVPAPGFALAAIKGLSHVAPRLPVLKLKNEDFSRDRKAVEILNNDPLIANEVQPASTVAALVRADERLREDFPRITLPLLILHGTDDKATVCHGSEFFHQTAGSKDKTLKLYEGHYHDLLNDIGKEGVVADILAWIDQRLPAS
ncbi:alpha/beta fold hydrolase [Ramlibacter sp. MAH-25]|uniref:Alpha/beta fold hydrolase n=1 Tax=Ramlibacter pinisoli TaxID=2682844 RepID=A0A6N8IZL6_9BURK|nr:alpha/beta hydrolase [Ramlibacter sp. CGMCC 1.13660]MVQ32045.1 alpha/beta fold hydrolase [Ramlibacter pinisoli]